MAPFIRIRLAGVGSYGEVGLQPDDTIARVADRACAKFPSWKADASQLHLFLVAEGGDEEPSDDAASAVLSGGSRLGAGWPLGRAGVTSGAWLVARAAGSDPVAEVAAIGKKIKAVEESVKSFSTKLGADVEAWQQAVNTELRDALSKVKEQVHKSAEVVDKCQRDVEALAAGRAPSPPSPEGGAGEPSAPVADAAAFAAMAKRIKVLEATLSAHEMALQAHTETLEAHASWLESLDGLEEEGAADVHAAPVAAAPAAAAAAPAAA